MKKFIVKVDSEDDILKLAENPKHRSVGVMHSELVAVNEMVAQARHREGVFDKKYPKGSWVEVDETSSSQLL